ncbi:glycerophosphodiester phosphodiesterase [Agromyces sp. NPDC056965]|uniref:glycerophosphodiester phosphodiesterase n=1 Tax=Agromyces sp. NPDC056965 TaxID=3345983 RepID=UPI00362CA171
MAHAPENSVQSYALAERVGANEIELDVRSTLDDVLIVLHDATLDRVAANERGTGLGPVAELRFDEVRQVLLDSGRPVLTLGEAYAATTVPLQVEIKERRCVEQVAEYMRSNSDDAARTLFTSFDADALADLFISTPFVPRGIIVHDYPSEEKYPEGIEALLERTGSDIFHCGWSGLTREVADAMHDAGLGVRGWPVKSLDDMRRAVAVGVDGITSDDPELAWSWHRQATQELAA